MNARRDKFYRNRYLRLGWVIRGVGLVCGIALPVVADGIHYQLIAKHSFYPETHYWPPNSVVGLIGLGSNCVAMVCCVLLSTQLKHWLSVIVLYGALLVGSGYIYFEIIRSQSSDALASLGLMGAPLFVLVGFVPSYLLAYVVDQKLTRRAWLRARFGCERCGYPMRRTHETSCTECGTARDPLVFPPGASNFPG